MRERRPPELANLEWVQNRDTAGRWYCDGEPIHAGTSMELHAPGTPLGYTERGEVTGRGPSRWLPVRIESQDAGRRLVAYHMLDGLMFKHPIDALDRLRWPPERKR